MAFNSNQAQTSTGKIKMPQDSSTEHQMEPQKTVYMPDKVLT